MAKTAATLRQERILATAWHEDVATATDALVRIARTLERIVALVEEEQAAEVAARVRTETTSSP
jgi:hypothetical protein